LNALVVFESMFGNTRQVAEAVADGLGGVAVPVAEASAERLAGADLVVIGGPTHGWSMSRPSTRQAAAEQAAKPGSGLQLEPGATGPGLREWLDEHAGDLRAAAVFDTRVAMPALLTGRAGRRIAAAVRHGGARPVAPAESFLVSKKHRLLPGELDRARQWGRRLAAVPVPQG
jgi:hypothetical protein